jgi:Tfp pilus assembly protein PilP
MRTVARTLIVAVVLAASAGAQAPSPPATGETLPAPAADYEYRPDGRRDPFVSLVNRGTEARSTPAGARPEGVAGIAVNELVVRGILQSRGGWIAMVATPSGRSYTVRPGDRLFDGTVRAINAQTVILMQDVTDPLSLEKQREVRKPLRGEVK